MKQQYYIEFSYEDIDSDNQILSNSLSDNPNETIPLVIIILTGAKLIINIISLRKL